MGISVIVQDQELYYWGRWKDNGTYYGNIWTWLLQQPLLWPTWLSPAQTLLCSETVARLITLTGNMNTSPQFSLYLMASYQREMWIKNPSLMDLHQRTLYML